MAVAALSSFPASFAAGDTLRIEGLTDADYPSSDWTLEVVLRGADGTLKTFKAESGDNNGYDLVVTASQTSKLPPQNYTITCVYNETAENGDRATVQSGSILITNDPQQVAAKSKARQTLEAMEDALQKLASGSNLSVSFNGHSFTKKNLKELQDAIDRQRLIVNREDGSGRRRYSGIAVRFGNDGQCWPWGANRGDFF